MVNIGTWYTVHSYLRHQIFLWGGIPSLWIFNPFIPTHSFFWGGICQSKTRFFGGVGSIALKGNFTFFCFFLFGLAVGFTSLISSKKFCRRRSLNKACSCFSRHARSVIRSLEAETHFSLPASAAAVLPLRLFNKGGGWLGMRVGGMGRLGGWGKTSQAEKWW